MERKGIASEIQLKDIDDQKGYVSGYLASYDTLDRDNEIFSKSAFTKTVNELGPNGKNDIRYLLDHDQTKAVGVFTELNPNDPTGLYYVAKVGTHNKGKDYLEMCKSGIIRNHSVGFKTIKRHPTDKRIISETKLFEGSGLQFFAANPNTPLLSVKSDGSFDVEGFEEMVSKLQRFNLAYKNGHFTDECFTNYIIPNLKALEAEVQQILSVKAIEAELLTSKSINPSELKNIFKQELLK